MFSMVEFKGVHGNVTEPLHVDVTTVYVRSNFKDISDEDNPNLWEYDEIQYTKDEYAQLMGEKSTEMSDEIVQARMEITDLDITSLEQQEVITELDIQALEQQETITDLDLTSLDHEERILALEGGN